VAVQQGGAVVKLLPVQDKREVAVSGLVSVRVPAEIFLQSFRESMARKSNPAILEIGEFSKAPVLDDLQNLTFEDRDIEDLKGCVVGDCKLKLSASMIDRLHKDVNWDSADYRLQVTQLLKRMLVEYVGDYLAQGDAALIKYNDKSTEVRLAVEHRALIAETNYFDDNLVGDQLHANDSSKSGLSEVENRIVWSKIKFGLKPVTAINHITIYKREQKTGPEILVVSKQLYANHYFDSSLALTKFITIPNSNESYLLYENRSRADSFEGPFGKIKHGIVENRAVAGLRTILEQSKANLDARTFNQNEPAPYPAAERRWQRWTIRGAYVLLWSLLIVALIALFALSNNAWNGSIRRPAHH
jgi:hypothetical protein